MIVKESDIRAKIRRLLSEGRMTFYSPLGREEDFNIMTPEINGVHLDLSKDSSFDVIRLSKIVNAMTSAGFQNVIAWQTVAEGFLQNFGFSAPLGKNSHFYDVTKDDVGYSVKSSFSKESNIVPYVILNNSKLDFKTLFIPEKSGAVETGQYEIKDRKGDIKKISIIICYRTDNRADNTFTIHWKKTTDIELSKFVIGLQRKFPQEAPKVVINVNDSLKNLTSNTAVQQNLNFSNFSNLQEVYRKASESEIQDIFEGDFQTFLTITFKDFSKESTDSYKQKLEIMNVLRRASDEQLSSIFDYFQSNGFFESNQSQ